MPEHHPNSTHSSSVKSIADWDPEPFLNKIVGVAPNVIHIYNHQTHANEYSNRKLEDYLGYSPEELQQMGADALQILVNADDIPKIGEHVATVQSLPDGEVAEVEFRMRHKEGRWVWFQSRDTVFERDASGKVLRHVGVASDVTDLKVAEQAALFGQAKAENANDELRSFAYSMSHDLKSPSNTLALLLSELKETQLENLDEDGRDILEMSLMTVGRMQGLIEDVLAYTRVIGSQNDVTSVDLNALLQQALDDATAAITQGKALVSVDTLPVLMGNPSQLRTLFQNLIENAVKYASPDRRPKIHVRDISSEKDDVHKIAVSDNGIGIAPKDQAKIFEMFRRLHRQDEISGSGLGLSICRRIAISHGGEISVQSGAEGSTFMVTLPRA